MTKRHPLLASLVLLLLACATQPPPAARPTGAVGDHGYALLYELLGQEKNVATLLIVKRDREDFEAVIEAISDVTGRAHDALGELGETDPALNLTDTGLPRAERAARESIAATKRNALLTENGEEFEILMSLAQGEALGYLVGLTDALSRAEPDPARLAFTRDLWRESREIQERLLALQRARR